MSSRIVRAERTLERMYVGAPGPATAGEGIIPTLVVWAGLGVVLLCAAVLVVLACFERHTAYVRAHPWRFAAELTAVATVCSAPVFLCAYLRGAPQRRAARDYAILVAKFAVFWLLCEFTGANEIVFARSV